MEHWLLSDSMCKQNFTRLLQLKAKQMFGYINWYFLLTHCVDVNKRPCIKAHHSLAEEFQQSRMSSTLSDDHRCGALFITQAEGLSGPWLLEEEPGYFEEPAAGCEVKEGLLRFQSWKREMRVFKQASITVWPDW